MNDDFLRGVNFGGWLVLEKWMTPTLFAGTDAVDEYTFSKSQGAKQKIEQHRKTFITEEDFQWLVGQGINALRIPVGYWVLAGDGPYIEAKKYLDWAMKMSDKYKLKVIVDVHGLPGSQNGRDHSGRVGRAAWYRDSDYYQQWIEAVRSIAMRYRGHPSLWGVQVINEPKLGLFHRRLRRYYQKIYQELSRILEPTITIVTSDAFTPRLMSGALKPKNHPMVMDVHSYHMATPLATWFSIDWFFKKLQRRKKMFRRLSKSQPLIIGEWSGVISHRTMRQVPKASYDSLFAKYVRLQQDVYSETAGWFYWSYKTEGSGQWNFRSAVELGLIDIERPTN